MIIIYVCKRTFVSRDVCKIALLNYTNAISYCRAIFSFMTLTLRYIDGSHFTSFVSASLFTASTFQNSE